MHWVFSTQTTRVAIKMAVNSDMNEITCQVESVEQIKAHVYRVLLGSFSKTIPTFMAGQYLSINMPSRDGPSFFSIASRPGLGTIELHVQADPHLESPVEIIDYLIDRQKKGEAISVSLPYGQACLTNTPASPIILLAAGTGFAQMKSIIEQLQYQHFSYPISLYWGVRKPEDMYLKSLAEQWDAQSRDFHFVPLIANIDDNQGIEHHSRMADAVLSDQADLKHSRVFVSGSPKLVFSAMEVLREAGLPEQQFFSDVLQYQT